MQKMAAGFVPHIPLDAASKTMLFCQYPALGGEKTPMGLIAIARFTMQKTAAGFIPPPPPPPLNCKSRFSFFSFRISLNFLYFALFLFSDKNFITNLLMNLSGYSCNHKTFSPGGIF
jgi:hypothetical protein